MPASRLPGRWPIRLSLYIAPVLAIGLLLVCLHLAATAKPSLADQTGQSPSSDGISEGQTIFTHNDGLPANGVTALLGDEKGLWIGTTAGLSYYSTRGRDAGLRWQTFTKQDGLSADAVSDLWQDEAGELWVAHPDGYISQFDGSSWTTYDSLTETLSQAYKQIVDANVKGPLWAIEEGGRVWTLADDTVGYYVGAVWRPYGEDAGIPSGELVAVWTGDDGTWVASENGQIGYFDGANWTTFRSPYDAVQRQYDTIVASGPSADPLWVSDNDGAVWVRNAFNQRDPRPDVRRFADGQWSNFSVSDGMASGFVEELRLDEHGRLWARHAADGDGVGGGLSLFVGEQPNAQSTTGSWVAITPAVGGNVTDFWPEGTDGVWIGSYYQPTPGGVPIGGLTYVDLNTWQHFPSTALTGAAISDTWLDENGNLWLGQASAPQSGLTGGLWRYRESKGTQPARWTPVQGLADDDVRDLWGDGAGNLWVATAGGVNRITLKNHKMVSFTQPIRPDRIAGDSQGNVWAVALGDGGGVWQWDGKNWSSHTVSEGLSGGAYADALVSADGDVYLAGDRGLDMRVGNKWKTFSALPGLNVRRVWEDTAGALWLSSEITPGRPFNLSLNQGNRWKTVLNEKASREMGPEPSALLRDSRGAVWLGTPMGLYVYKPSSDSRWRGLGPVDGLPAGPVNALFEDAEGTMWVAIGDQVFRADILACPQPSVGACGDWVRFEPQTGIVHHIAAGPDGSVILAGEAGTALFQPNRPELRLERVTNLITGEIADGSEPVILTLGQNAAQIDLVTSAPMLTDRQFSYQYRLEGTDEGWRVIPARFLGGKRASITYAGLPDGVYTFTVAARSDTLDASPEISLTLYVVSRPPRLFLEGASVAGHAVAELDTLRSFAQQPIQMELGGGDDQLEPLTYRYRIEGLGDEWTETTSSVISFTLSNAGTFTFAAVALDSEGQSSDLIGSQIVVSEREQAQDSTEFPITLVAAGLGALAVLFIVSAIILIMQRRRRESW